MNSNIISNKQMIISLEELKESGLSFYKINQLVKQGVLKKLNKKYSLTRLTNSGFVLLS